MERNVAFFSRCQLMPTGRDACERLEHFLRECLAHVLLDLSVRWNSMNFSMDSVKATDSNSFPSNGILMISSEDENVALNFLVIRLLKVQTRTFLRGKSKVDDVKTRLINALNDFRNGMLEIFSLPNKNDDEAKAKNSMFIEALESVHFKIQTLKKGKNGQESIIVRFSLPWRQNQKIYDGIEIGQETFGKQMDSEGERGEEKPILAAEYFENVKVNKEKVGKKSKKAKQTKFRDPRTTTKDKRIEIERSEPMIIDQPVPTATTGSPVTKYNKPIGVKEDRKVSSQTENASQIDIEDKEKGARMVDDGRWQKTKIRHPQKGKKSRGEEKADNSEDVTYSNEPSNKFELLNIEKERGEPPTTLSHSRSSDEKETDTAGNDNKKKLKSGKEAVKIGTLESAAGDFDHSVNEMGNASKTMNKKGKAKRRKAAKTRQTGGKPELNSDGCDDEENEEEFLQNLLRESTASREKLKENKSTPKASMETMTTATAHHIKNSQNSPASSDNSQKEPIQSFKSSPNDDTNYFYDETKDEDLDQLTELALKNLEALKNAFGDDLSEFFDSSSNGSFHSAKLGQRKNSKQSKTKKSTNFKNNVKYN